VEAPDFSPGSGFFRTRENQGFHTTRALSPGNSKTVDFITVAIFETRSQWQGLFAWFVWLRGWKMLPLLFLST